MADDDVKSPSLTRLEWLRDELEPWMTKYFQEHAQHQSVLLAVAQYWADEADDAVHLEALASTSRVPDFFSTSWEDEGGPQDTFALSWKHRPSWDDNGESIRAFQAYCGEGGSQELPPADQAEVFGLITRAGSGVEFSWLGRCQRPWLDLPNTALPGFMGDSDGDPEDREPLDVELPAQTLDAADVKCLEAIASDPFGEGPRRVWADMWLSRNDPRGAFMQQRSAPREALMQRGEFWLGELNQCVPLGSATFEYGSLAAADVAFDDERVRLAESPWWLSVHTLRFSGEHEVFTPRMKGLRHVSGLTDVGLLALKDFAGTPLLESLHASLDLEALEVLTALPLKSLRTLTLTVSAGARLSKLKLPTSTWLKLEHVRIARPWELTYEWDEEGGGDDDEMPSLDELRAALPYVPRVSVCSGDSAGLPSGWELSLSRGQDDVASLRLERLGPAARRSRLDAQLAGLPSSVKTVRCEPSRLWAPAATFSVGKGRKAQVG